MDSSPIPVCILNSGGQDHYLQGLAGGLARHHDLRLEVIDFEHLALPPNVTLRPTGPDRRRIPTRIGKARALAIAYLRSLWTIARSPAVLVHIQWLIHFEALDRILIPLWCLLWGKRYVVTVHNVDVAQRNRGRSGAFHRATLAFYYRRAAALIAHTSNIRSDLIHLGAAPENIALIPHGLNQQVRRRGITQQDARAALDLPIDAKVLLFFGSLAHYKGLDVLLDAMRTLEGYHLVIAGRPADEAVHASILLQITQNRLTQRTRLKITYLADEEIEPLFAAADCVVLPYRSISQSGVPFLAFSFGLPVVATRVGGLPETIEPGLSGTLAVPEDPADLARAIEETFRQNLSRDRIRQWAESRYSWHAIARETVGLYRRLAQPRIRVAVVHNFCTHYTRALFESLARRFDTRYLFFSGGQERYWLPEHGVSTGAFRFRYLKGFSIAGTRITPALLTDLLLGRYDVFVKCINGRFALPATYLCARLRRKPFILYSGVWHRLSKGAQRFLFPLLRHIYRHADAIVVYGDHVRRYLLTEGIDPEKIFVAPHAVDNDVYGRVIFEEEIASLRASLDVPTGHRIILYLGRFEPVKGLDYLLDAVRRTKAQNWILVLAGAGQLRDALKLEVQNDAVLAARVRFADYVAPAKTPVFYAASWASVLPSIATSSTREPWGLVVNEAFNQGSPVIATDVVGAVAGGLLRDNVNGLVVPERDSNALARAIDRLVLDDDLRDNPRDRLGAAARQEVAAWTQEARADGFDRAIRFAVAKGRALAPVAPPVTSPNAERVQ